MSKPWDVPGVPWATEAAFYGWVRGQLRRGWSRHPVKNLLIQNNRFKKDNGKGRYTWHLECSICKKDTPQTKIQVDHTHPAGSLKTTEDIGKFVERLYFVTFDTIRIVCIPCHEVITFAERKNISFDEAVLEKQCLKIMSKKASDLNAWLYGRGYEYKTPKKENIDNVREAIKKCRNTKT